MEDVAQACGVTKKTVSRVFAGSPAVKAETKAKILEAAKRLKYEFNTLAQNFSAKRSRFIGIALACDRAFGTGYFKELYKGFASVLNDTEMDFAFFDTDTESFNNGTKLAKLYRQRRVDGLLIVAPHTYDRFLKTLEEVHIPMVVVGVQPSFEGICSVSCNDSKGIRLLCEHLHSLGHRRIAFVSGLPFVTTAEQRKQAYIDFCQEKRLEIPTEYIQPGDFTAQSGWEAMHTLFKMTPRPTAIIAANDPMACGVAAAARDLGLRVPEDISVAGFDDLPFESERISTLTTVHQPAREMGEKSATLLLESLRAGNLPAGQTVLDVHLVPRETTAAPAQEAQPQVRKSAKTKHAA